MEFKTINGLQWAMEDLVAGPNRKDVWEVNGKCYFTFDAAQREAEKRGLRVPKASEWMSLGESMDMDYARIVEKLRFDFPGFRDWNGGRICSSGYEAFFWSSTKIRTVEESEVFGGTTLLKSGRVDFGNYTYSKFGLSVRCIKD